jgi:ubiquinone/menaquinone biosynthesis C-methylase UbiE
MITRWDAWYSDDNLKKDAGILAALPSRCAKNAAVTFRQRGIYQILDVACGVGRDTAFFKEQGLLPIGVDASFNGLKAAYHLKMAPGEMAKFVTADARCLPFKNASFDGIYCFGLLHEFVGADKDDNIGRVIAEIKRLLCKNGVLAIAALAGNPEDGLPQVQLFTQQMFENAMAGWTVIEIKCIEDVGCTNKTGYRVWSGLFKK